MKRRWVLPLSDSLNLNDIGNCQSWRYSSFSFLGLGKCTRMDSSEGRIYMTSIWYPLQACVKIKRYSPSMVGKMEPKSLSCRQYVALEHGTCLHSCRVGDISSHFSLASVDLGDLFWPLIYSLPRHRDLWSFDVKYCQIHCRAINMFKRSWPLQISTFLWFSSDSDSQRHYVPLSHIDDVGNTMAHLRSRSLPVDFSSLSRKLI